MVLRPSHAESEAVAARGSRQRTGHAVAGGGGCGPPVAIAPRDKYVLPEGYQPPQ